jgi:hypothetical protein
VGKKMGKVEINMSIYRLQDRTQDELDRTSNEQDMVQDEQDRMQDE